jgi:hypothetical protein
MCEQRPMGDRPFFLCQKFSTSQQRKRGYHVVVCRIFGGKNVAIFLRKKKIEIAIIRP